MRPGKQNGERFLYEYKRKASYETLGKSDPLVVFAPKEIKSLLYKHLKGHFGICEFCKIFVVNLLFIFFLVVAD